MLNNCGHLVLVLAAVVCWSVADAMGLRSFVALPVEKHGTIGRLQLERNPDRDGQRLILNLAHGLSAKQTLLLGVPYRISDGGGNPTGDISVLLRQIGWQSDGPARTSRIGLLAGVAAPTQSDRRGAIQGGAVATLYRGRYEWDLDLLFATGRGEQREQGRYDISWQYRLIPDEYPDWGTIPEWHLVLELGGRWMENGSTTHQITSGLQWIHSRWVLEGGVIEDLDRSGGTHFLLSLRFHF